MAYRYTKNTLGQVSGDGVLVAKSTLYPVGRTAVPSAVGTESVPVVSGTSQIVEYKVSFSNPSGASSVWFLPAPAGKWRIVDCTVIKTGALGVAGDTVTVKSVKSGTTSASLLATAGDTELDLAAVPVGGIVRASYVLEASSANVIDSSKSDKLEVTLAKGGANVACELRLKLELV